MKPTINKSRLMKDAHRMKKYEKLEMSIAMKLAWITEKKKVKAEVDAYLWNMPSDDYVQPTNQELYDARANWNYQFYNGIGYKGD